MIHLQNILISKVKTMIEKQRIADHIKHNPTKGALRESYLRDFLIDIIPSDFDTTTGFVSSSNQDSLSPQIDLIICDKKKTPRFLLSDSQSVITFESAFLLIEVKTNISKKVVNQVKTQNDFIEASANPQFFSTYIHDDLKAIGDKLSVGLRSVNNFFDKPSPFIVAFSSSLNDDSLKDLFTSINRLSGIWIVGKKFIYPKAIGNLEIVNGDQSTLYAVDKIIESITIMAAQRDNYRINWKKYLIE
jgi:hypothetical protein